MPEFVLSPRFMHRHISSHSSCYKYITVSASYLHISTSNCNVSNNPRYAYNYTNQSVALWTSSYNHRLSYHSIHIISLYVYNSSFSYEGPYLPSRGLTDLVRPNLLATVP